MRVRTEEQKQKRREYLREWRASHMEGIRIYAAEWRKQNLDRARKSAAKARRRRIVKRREEWSRWAARNRDKIEASRRERYARNIEQFRAKRRAVYQRDRKRILAANSKWEKAHREVKRKHNRAYARRYPERMAALCEKRRARLIGALVEDCSAKIKELRNVKVCSYCYETIVGTTHVDHVIPLSRGGKHAPDNLTAACSSCNGSKGAKLLWEWQPERYKEAA